MYPVGNPLMGGPLGTSGHSTLPWSNSVAPTPLTFLENIDVMDLYKFTNDTINHYLISPANFHEIPVDIPKF